MQIQKEVGLFLVNGPRQRHVFNARRNYCPMSKSNGR